MRDQWLNGHSPEHKTRCRLEDVIARLSQVESCANVIRVQAWNQGSWAAVGIEAKTMLRELDSAKADLAALWATMTAIIDGEVTP